MKSLLVVDDEPDIAAVLADILEDEGYRVVTAFHGQAALEVLARESFDLVISDLMMPVLNGAELLRRLRAEPRWAQLPVVLISAAPVDEGVRALADAFLTKPFDLAALLDTVAALLSGSRARREG
jgi:CheY-like chemotaxis protein